MKRYGRWESVFWPHLLAPFYLALLQTLLSPYIADLAIKLGPWEYFSLCFCAITLVAALSKGSIFKGMLSAFLGLFLCSVGVAPIDGAYRYTFGNIYLGGGLNMVALMLGIYAIKQVVGDYAKGQQELPAVNVGKIHGFGVKPSDFSQNLDVIIKSFLVGLWIGFLPGMGSGLSNLVAYAQAKAGSKQSDEYGKGHPGGIWASETSNNALGRRRFDSDDIFGYSWGRCNSVATIRSYDTWPAARASSAYVQPSNCVSYFCHRYGISSFCSYRAIFLA